ncbi:MAG: DUF2284 domain-containing protein [Eubacteriales bacterium]
MLNDRLIAAFNEIGFDEYKEITVEDIIFSQDVFDQCARNTCGNFGKNHACPPKAGTEEERKARVLKYQHGFLISKIVPIKSRQEMVTSMETIDRINKTLRKIFSEDDVFIMGAGACTLCETCTALEEKPCRFPDKTQYSMEGSGIDVVSMSMNKQMTYNAGQGKVGYFTLVLYN